MVVIVFFNLLNIPNMHSRTLRFVYENGYLAIVFVGDNRPTKKKAKKSPNPSGNVGVVSTIFLVSYYLNRYRKISSNS